MPKAKAVLFAACLSALLLACVSCLPEPNASGSPAARTQTADGCAATATPDKYAAFDGAVFIGDCTTLRLKNYVTEKRQSEKDFLGTAQFLAAAGLGSYSALQEPGPDSKHPPYKGEKLSVEDAVARIGAKKAYIMLGLGDLNLYTPDDTILCLETLIGRIVEKSPGITICVQSAGPVARKDASEFVNNRSLIAYNDKLRALCEAHGYRYLDVAGALRDSEGWLPDKYASADEAHSNEAFCTIWIEYLLAHPA